MASISVNGRIFPDIQLIAFDKDGTLADFHLLWGERSRQWIDFLVRRAGSGIDDPPILHQTLCRSLGFDPQANRIVHDSPLAVASFSKICAIAAAVLYQHGSGWLEAEQIVADSLPQTINLPLSEDEIRPIGNVRETFGRLVSSGIQIAVITSDDRAAAEALLPMLGITPFVSVLVCGDDDLPNKPAPDALWHVGRLLNLPPSQMLMVGDTVGDMLFGRRAGTAGCIGILGGAGDQAALRKTADEVIQTVEDIGIIG